MLKTVRGTYKNGQVTLVAPPAGVREARVLVTFLKPRRPRRGTTGTSPRAAPAPGSDLITFGMFKTDRPIDEADFRAAEWRGDAGGVDGD